MSTFNEMWNGLNRGEKWRRKGWGRVYVQLDHGFLWWSYGAGASFMAADIDATDWERFDERAEKAEKERDEARAEFHRLNDRDCQHIAFLEERAEKAEAQLARMEASPQTADGLLAARLNVVERERDEWRANAEAAEVVAERQRERAKSAERERDAHRAACEKAERERDEARAEFHASNEHHCRHVAQLEARAEAAQMLHKAAAATRPEDWDDTVVELQERAEKAERAAAAMREQLEGVLEVATATGVGSVVLMRPGEKGWSIASVRAALASGAGKDFLSREQVRTLLVRAVNRASLATATRKDIGPGAVMDDKRVGALVDAVLKECDRGS